MNDPAIAIFATLLAVGSAASVLAARHLGSRGSAAARVLMVAALLPSIGTLALFGRLLVTDDPRVPAGSGSRVSAATPEPTSTPALAAAALPGPRTTGTAAVTVTPAATAIPTATATPVTPETPTPATPPSTPPEGIRVYVVRRGDWMAKIADRLGVGLGELIAANDLPDATRIEVGQVLLVP